MAQRKALQFVLTSLVLILLLSLPIPQNLETEASYTKVTSRPARSVPVLANYTEHAPILIESNSDFETQGWPGNGTSVNPYVIKGLNITSDEDCIQIHYTSGFFVIQDCYLGSDSGWNDCINLRFSGNAVIANCVLDTQFNGIFLYESDNVEIKDTIIASSRGPVRAVDSSGFRVYNCTFPEVDLRSFPLRFTLDHCSNALVNMSEFNDVYISTSGSSFTTITSCNFTHGGLLLSWAATSTFAEFSDNFVNRKPLLMLDGNDSLVIEADNYGQIILLDCSNIIVQNGNFTETRPVQLMNCFGCTIDNITAWGGASGIYDYDSNFTTVRNCNFIGVFGGGVFMTYCDFLLVENCNSTPTILSGMQQMIVQGCANSTVTQCRILTSRALGLQLTGDDMRLSNCEIEGGRYGIAVYGTNITIDNNYIHSMSSENVHPFFSTAIQAIIRNCTISNNLIENGDDRGIFAMANASLFVNNTIRNNEGIGLELSNTSNGNVLYDNILTHNLLGNALDNGFDNQWDDGISVGNLWSDFNPNIEGQYHIPGTAESIDRFPRTDTEYPPTGSNTSTPEPSQFPDLRRWLPIILVSSGLVLIVIVIVLRKRLVSS
ncbi:MAG: right-handed parallel beta-helix repeat-containing protein [Candidatus Thorarchaeota archaeon]